MRRPSGFLGNWLALASSDLGAQALALLAVPRVARGLGPEGYGHYTLALSTAALCGLVAGAGLSAVIVTEVAKRDGAARPLLRPVVALRSLSFALAGLLALAIISSTGARLDPVMAALTITLVGNATALDVLESIAFGRRIVRYSSTLNLANGALWVALLYLLPSRLLDARGILTLYTALQIAQALAYAILLLRSSGGAGGGRSAGAVQHQLTTNKRAAEAPPGARSLLARGLPYLWVNLTGVILVQAPVLLLAAGAGTEQVGLYSAGYRLALPITLLLGALARAALPLLVTGYRDNPARFHRVVREALALVAALAAPAAVLLTGAAPEVVSLILGPAYAGAAPVLGLLAGAMACLALLSVLGLAVSAMERQRWLALLSTVATALALPLIVLGAWDSAATLAGLVAIAYLLSLALHLALLAGTLGLQRRGLGLLPPVAVAVAAAALFPHDAPASLRWPLALALAVALLLSAVRRNEPLLRLRIGRET